MFIDDFETFIQEAEELYRARPLDTRYCIKYRHCDGKLVLKVTDDVKVHYQGDGGDGSGSRRSPCNHSCMLSVTHGPRRPALRRRCMESAMIPCSMTFTHDDRNSMAWHGCSYSLTLAPPAPLALPSACSSRRTSSKM